MTAKKSTDARTTPKEWKYDPNLIGRYVMELNYLLPVYVHIEDGHYDVNLGRRSGQIYVKRIPINTPLSKFMTTNEGNKIRIPGLRNDPFNRTSVTVRFKPIEGEMKLRQDPEKWDKDPITEGSYEPILEVSLKFVNRLLTGYQKLTGESTIDIIRPWEIGIFRGKIMLPEEKKTLKLYPIVIGAGGRPIQITAGETYGADFQQNLRDLLVRSWKFPLHEKLLSDANHLYLRGLYSSSIVVAQSALEVYIRSRLRRTKYSRARLKGGDTRKVDRIGLMLLMKVALNRAFRIDIAELEPELWRNMQTSTKSRNKITHRGKEASMNEASFAIRTFSDIIAYLENTLEK